MALDNGRRLLLPLTKAAVELGERLRFRRDPVVTVERSHPFLHEQGTPEVEELALDEVRVGRVAALLLQGAADRHGDPRDARNVLGVVRFFVHEEAVLVPPLPR